MNRDAHIIHSLFVHFVLLVGLFFLLLLLHARNHQDQRQGHLNSTPIIYVRPFFFGRKKTTPPHLLGVRIFDKIRRRFSVMGGIPNSQVIIADRLGLMVLLDHELGEVFGRSATWNWWSFGGFWCILDAGFLGMKLVEVWVCGPGNLIKIGPWRCRKKLVEHGETLTSKYQLLETRSRGPMVSQEHGNHHQYSPIPNCNSWYSEFESVRAMFLFVSV